MYFKMQIGAEGLSTAEFIRYSFVPASHIWEILDSLDTLLPDFESED
jgi:hypothetical protein